MIWAICIVFALGVGFYIGLPLIRKGNISAGPVTDTAKEINAYQQQLQTLDNTDADRAAKHKLQRTLLAQTNMAALARQSSGGEQEATTQRADGLKTGSKWMYLWGLGGAICAASLFLYSVIGTPDWNANKDGTAAQNWSMNGPNKTTDDAPNTHSDLSMPEIIARLERALKDDPSSIEGWRLYSRSLLALGRYDESKAAFAKAVALSNSAPDLLGEQKNILAYIDRMSGVSLETSEKTAPARPRALTAQEMQSGQAMNDTDRSAMIMGMINGLAERLADEPTDMAGWKRLLRARAVLGRSDGQQAKQLKVDVQTVRETFKDDPRMIDEILAAATLK